MAALSNVVSDDQPALCSRRLGIGSGLFLVNAAAGRGFGIGRSRRIYAARTAETLEEVCHAILKESG